MTVQLAPTPHVPGHGSRHCLLIQARLKGQSELERHSGLQGSPVQGLQIAICVPYTSHVSPLTHGDG